MSKPLKARPTMYKNIRMRSRLEAGFAAWLDNSGLVWEYEPCAFATQEGQYLPDFRVTDMVATWLPAPVTAYIEVKPESFPVSLNAFGTDDPNHGQIAMGAHAIAQSDPDALFVLATPSFGVALIFKPSWAGELIEYAYATSLRLIKLPNNRPGLALPIPAGTGPFEGEYWKPDGLR
ncbi:hypothetical protein [Actinomadura hibisca]|uniref:hypothetical protein n=1 Tax=Actinomadura hibisca TaxID=68565 RepID=UPI000829FD4E|nr:hypothetical protein [Actinomadura hibisca]